MKSFSFAQTHRSSLHTHTRADPLRNVPCRFKQKIDCVAAQSGCTIDRLCSGEQDGPETVGTDDGTDDSTDDGNVQDINVTGESAGPSVTRVTTLSFVLPMLLSGLAVLL